MANIGFISFFLVLATVQADIYYVDETENPASLDQHNVYYEYLKNDNGDIHSNSIGAVDAAFIWILPENFSSNSEALVIRIKSMQMDVYDQASGTYYCRRDLLYLGINLCASDPGTCFVFYPRDTTCENLDQSTVDCEKTYWIRHNLNSTHGIILGEPRDSGPSFNNWFEINYSVKNCTTKEKVSDSSMTKQFNEERKIIFILGTLLGIVTLLLLVVSITWCIQSKKRRDAQKPISNGITPPLAPPDDDHTYASPQDAYAMAGPYPPQAKISEYDTIKV